MTGIACSWCDDVVETSIEELEKHVKDCAQAPVTRAEFTRTAKQVEEIHTFLNQIAQALNNPMLKAMLPPGMF